MSFKINHNIILFFVNTFKEVRLHYANKPDLMTPCYMSLSLFPSELYFLSPACSLTRSHSLTDLPMLLRRILFANFKRCVFFALCHSACYFLFGRTFIIYLYTYVWVYECLYLYYEFHFYRIQFIYFFFLFFRLPLALSFCMFLSITLGQGLIFACSLPSPYLFD